MIMALATWQIVKPDLDLASQSPRPWCCSISIPDLQSNTEEVCFIPFAIEQLARPSRMLTCT
jgi:hypothetical protein